MLQLSSLQVSTSSLFNKGTFRGFHLILEMSDKNLGFEFKEQFFWEQLGKATGCRFVVSIFGTGRGASYVSIKPLSRSTNKGLTAKHYLCSCYITY